MNEGTGFDHDSLSEGFTGRERLLARIAASDNREEWIAEVAAHAARQSDIFVELINRCPFGIYLVDERLRIVAMNERSQAGAFRNVRPVIGRAFDEAMHILWPDETAQEIIGRFRHTLESGEPYHSKDFVEPRADIDEVEGYEWELHCIRLPEGRRGVICYYFDATELRQTQRALAESARHQQLLIDELNHRVKNTLAIVQSLAHQSFRLGSADMRAAFDGRLGALAKAHETLTRVTWEQADLSEVIAGAMDGCGVSDRVDAAGPPMWLDAKAAVTVAMAFHELATNALKYGALSQPEGRVAINWTHAEGNDGGFHLRWTERGGPPVTPPARRGFGSRMLERALVGELKAEVALDFHPAGLVCSIGIGADRATAGVTR